MGACLLLQNSLLEKSVQGPKFGDKFSLDENIFRSSGNIHLYILFFISMFNKWAKCEAKTNFKCQGHLFYMMNSDPVQFLSKWTENQMGWAAGRNGFEQQYTLQQGIVSNN